MKKSPFHIALCLTCCCVVAALTACSDIAEDERLVVTDVTVVQDSIPSEPVETDSLWDAPVEPVAHRVLIEDHTGQKCPNCPDATRLIHNYQRQYGDLIVPVAIHSEMQGIMEPEGLGNELGNTYYKYWKMEYKPAGLVNRLDGGTGKVLDKTMWDFAVPYALSMETPLDIRVKARQSDDPAQADIDVRVVCTSEDASASGQLQVWITEDGIIAEQDDMGVKIADYKHNHVLRAAVNGTWGESVSVSGFGDTREFSYTAALKPNWKAGNLSIVAFVYNDDGVVQAVSRPLKVNNQE